MAIISHVHRLCHVERLKASAKLCMQVSGNTGPKGCFPVGVTEKMASTLAGVRSFESPVLN